MFEVVSIKNLDLLCRLCLVECEDDNRFDPDQLAADFYRKIAVILQITIIQSLHKPNICKTCVEAVNNFYSFYDSVQQNNQIFNKQLENDYKSVVAKKDEHPQLEVELLSNIGPDDAIEFNEAEEDSRSKSEDTSYEENQNEGGDRLSRNLKHTKKANTRKNERKEREKEDAQIRQFMKLSCEMCTSSFYNFTEVKHHYTKVHKTAGFIRCCDQRYRQRYKLLDHIIHHMNPEAFKCDFCGKTFENSKGLLLHKQNHLPDEFKKFKCDQCAQCFAKASKLKAHLLCHVPEDEKSHICSTCNKSFPIPSMLQGHIRLIHENRRIYVCEICAKSFKTNQTLRNHQVTIHEAKQPRVKCEHCGQFYANESSLKKHLKRINMSGEVNECPECGHISPNRDSLRGHIERVHRRDRSQFECTICNKGFKVATNLKEHMASHTGERLYKCLFCPKEFNSNANKYSHQKKKHPSEWQEQNRKRMLGIA